MSTSNPTAAELAGTAAEAVRALNHVTYGVGLPGWHYPGDAYDTVAGLTALARRLPQTFEQVSGLLVGLHEVGHLTSGKGDASEDVDALTGAMADASAAALAMAKALDTAHAALGPVGYAD